MEHNRIREAAARTVKCLSLAVSLGLIIEISPASAQSRQPRKRPSTYTNGEGLEGAADTIKTTEDTTKLFVTQAEIDSAKKLYERGQLFQAKTDTMWQIFEQEKEPPTSLEDSSRLTTDIRNGIDILNAFPELSAKLSRKEIEKLIHNSERAEHYFLDAARVYPSWPNAKEGLAKSLENEARLFGLKENLMRANKVLQGILTGNPGRFTTLYYLSENYFKLKQYGSAMKYLTRAEDVAIRKSYFDVRRSKEPPAYPPLYLSKTWRKNLYAVLSYRLECEEALGLTENVARTIMRIVDIAPNKEDREAYLKRLEDIRNFGNVAGLKEMYELRKLMGKKQWEDARTYGLKLMKEIEGTPGYDNVALLVSQIEFNALGEREDGYNLLRPVVEKILKREERVDRDQDVFNAFGPMCLNLGTDKEKENKPKKALEFYKQGSDFDWKYKSEDGSMQSGRGLCYYYIALLYKTNTDSCGRYLKKALDANVAPEYQKEVTQELINCLIKQEHYAEADALLNKSKKSINERSDEDQ